MATNPNPSRITSASWYFMEALLAMESGTQNVGIWVNKPGYHGTREENQARDRQDGTIDYSVRDAIDLLGPGDKAAAYDWKHVAAAQSGDYRSMVKYGQRLAAAFDVRDPRLRGWKEAQGQTDLDATPEELDFGTWTRHTPSSSHAWHWHFSERRAYVESRVNKDCMLSILRGESLTNYLARGGQLIGDDDDMSALTEQQINDLWHALIPDPPKRTQGSWTWTRPDGRTVPINPLYLAVDQVAEKVDQVAEKVEDISVPSAPQPLPVDVAELVQALTPQLVQALTPALAPLVQSIVASEIAKLHLAAVSGGS